MRRRAAGTVEKASSMGGARRSVSSGVGWTRGRNVGAAGTDAGVGVVEVIADAGWAHVSSVGASEVGRGVVAGAGFKRVGSADAAETDGVVWVIGMIVGAGWMRVRCVGAAVKS